MIVATFLQRRSGFSWLHVSSINQRQMQSKISIATDGTKSSQVVQISNLKLGWCSPYGHQIWVRSLLMFFCPLVMSSISYYAQLSCYQLIILPAEMQTKRKSSLKLFGGMIGFIGPTLCCCSQPLSIDVRFGVLNTREWWGFS